ncbi:MAG: NhaA family Na+:H+ antiporter [Candidatus Krumholzibacteriia bacterium]|jgi:NhaA family Na+:H+ antiporter
MTQTRLPFLDRFLQMESAGGLLLMVAAALALVVANSPLVGLYNLLLDTPVDIRVGGLEVAKPLLLWINDGLMAVFFFLIGLELKRELVEGELADKRNIILPGLGAIGGMAIPALVYLAFNRGDAIAQQGWAIPAATDIAFALGILSLLGSRVPTTVKIFLTSLAIFDDIGAILIIAMFYTSKISMVALAVVGGCIAVLALMTRLKVEARSLFIFVGVVMWTAMLKSGVHATLAGVVLAMFIPMRSTRNPEYSPLKSLEHDLHSVVAFVILPIFAFANAGISFAGLESEQVLHGVSIGVALGLFVGKQIGVFGFCALGIRAGMASMPVGMNWRALYGTAAMTGVGFTMSLFIGSLAFESAGLDRLFDERIGIIAGSLASGLLGYFILRRVYGGSKA